MTLQEINNQIHSIPNPSELESSLADLKTSISTAITNGDIEFNAQYYRNHTGRELFKKLNNFGLYSEIFDDYDSGFRPNSTAGL